MASKFNFNTDLKPHKIKSPLSLFAVILIILAILSLFLFHLKQIIAGYIILGIFVLFVIFVVLCFTIPALRIKIFEDKLYSDWINKQIKGSSSFNISAIESSKTQKNLSSGKTLESVKLKKEGNNFLSFNARIDFFQEGGCAPLLKVTVNNKLLSRNLLSNKPPIFNYISGKSHSWFSDKSKSWSLLYSKNFKSNYSHPIYKVLDGEPYKFLFNITTIESKDDKYHIKFEHIGNTFSSEHSMNDIIIDNIEII